EYKSAIRSRRLIKEAYITLLKHTNTNKISITAIVRQADINRGTFYAHYRSPHDVLEEITNDFLANFLVILQEFHYASFLKDPLPLLKKFSHCFEKDNEFFKNLIAAKGCEPFMTKLKKLLLDYITNDAYIPEKVKNEDVFKVAIVFFCSGIVSTFQDWMEGELVQNTEAILHTINNIIVQMAKPIVEGLL
ncbi:MAG TPA: TetR/AcrR family transcriptional regulator, partial [Treponemataceae bacterium]|nr:TetR/AcrR family transcriptional regulator [Treponemataceae bacterium]